MISKELMESQKKSYIANFYGVYKNVGTLKKILRGRGYYLYSYIKPFFYEAIKEAIKHIIVNKDKYNMDSEDLNNCLKCYNVYNNADRSFDFLREEDYISKLETITDKIEFDFEGEHYSYELLKN